PQMGADSEAVLAAPELQQVAGKRVLIIRGDDGRPVLGESLTARGAKVEYAECYRRVRPNVDATPLLAAWRRGEVHGVVALSPPAWPRCRGSTRGIALRRRRKSWRDACARSNPTRAKRARSRGRAKKRCANRRCGLHSSKASSPNRKASSSRLKRSTRTSRAI